MCARSRRNGGPFFQLCRAKYRADGIERKPALGKYPAVALSDACKARDTARASASAGANPAAAKRRERIARKLAAGATFGVWRWSIKRPELHCARDWLQLGINGGAVSLMQNKSLLHEVVTLCAKPQAMTLGFCDDGTSADRHS